jgi:tetratricopeptide (TPR) repeat protein
VIAHLSRLTFLLSFAVVVAGCDAPSPLDKLKSDESDESSRSAPGLDIEGESVDGLIVGHRLMAAGEHELALKSYTRSAADQGLTPDVLSAIGSVNLKLGRLHQAEEMLRTAIERDPKFVPAWNNLGVVLMELGKVSEASRVFRTAFAIDNGNSEQIRLNLKLALAKAEDLQYDNPNNENFGLVRRGNGSYLLLASQ